MTMPPEGPIPGQGGVMQPNANAALAAYDTAYEAADLELTNAGKLVTAALQAQADLPKAPSEKEGYDPYAPGNASAAATYDAQVRAIEARYQSAQAGYNSALNNRQRAADARAQALATAAQRADPAMQAELNAKADKATTDAAKADAELKEWNATAGDRKAEVVAKQRLQNAQASVAETQAAYDKETQPAKKALLEADLKAKQAALVTANADAQVAGQLAGLRVQQAGATVAQTQAQTGLTGAQTALSNANAENVTTLQPGQIAQQGATLAQTQANTAEINARTNPLLAKINEITQAFKDGKLDSLPNPQHFVTDAIAAAGSGTTPFDIFKQNQSEETARLGQQVQQRDVESRLLGLKAGAFGQLAGSGLNSMVELNKTLPPGSDAAGKGYTGLIQAALLGLGGQNGFQLGPQVPIPNAPSYLSQYQSAPAPAQAPAPAAPTPTPPQQAPVQPDVGSGGGHTITINIGGSGGAQPQAFAQSDQPEGGSRGAPAYLDRQRLATPEDHAALFGQQQAA